MIVTAIQVLLGKYVPVDAEIRAQVIEFERKETKDRKPYVRMKLSDGSAVAELSVWSDHPAFATVLGMEKGQCYALTGAFHAGKYGLESKSWSYRMLQDEERLAVFAGPPELRAKQERDWAVLVDVVEVARMGF